jgi:hypothetical protein
MTKREAVVAWGLGAVVGVIVGLALNVGLREAKAASSYGRPWSVVPGSNGYNFLVDTKGPYVYVWNGTGWDDTNAAVYDRDW